ncbi:MAG: hypothetical protein Q9208_001221 [Pyrenodesmia sp. 3 TL-2023]
MKDLNWGRARDVSFKGLVVNPPGNTDLATKADSTTDKRLVKVFDEEDEKEGEDDEGADDKVEEDQKEEEDAQCEYGQEKSHQIIDLSIYNPNLPCSSCPTRHAGKRKNHPSWMYKLASCWLPLPSYHLDTPQRQLSHQGIPQLQNLVRIAEQTWITASGDVIVIAPEKLQRRASGRTKKCEDQEPDQ